MDTLEYVRDLHRSDSTTIEDFRPKIVSRTVPEYWCERVCALRHSVPPIYDYPSSGVITVLRSLVTISFR